MFKKEEKEMKKFTQIYAIDKEKLTKKEMLEEIGFDAWTAARIARKLKKRQIRDAWLTGYHGDGHRAVEKIRHYMNA